jgi:hypothetical protein
LFANSFDIESREKAFVVVDVDAFKTFRRAKKATAMFTKREKFEKKQIYEQLFFQSLFCFVLSIMTAEPFD